MLASMVGLSSTKAGVGNWATSIGLDNITGCEGLAVTVANATSIAVVKPPPTLLLPRLYPER